MDSADCGLLTDLYQLNMLQAYLEHGVTGTAVFEFFVRDVPKGRNFLVAAGLELAFDYLENLRFSEDDLAWLAGTGRFSKQVIDYLRGFRFTGAVNAMPEGTAFASLRSMYTSDHVADVARVAWRGPGATDWDEAPVLTFSGASAVSELWAGRRSKSRHNLSAPDMIFSHFASAPAPGPT